MSNGSAKNWVTISILLVKTPERERAKTIYHDSRLKILSHGDCWLKEMGPNNNTTRHAWCFFFGQCLNYTKEIKQQVK